MEVNGGVRDAPKFIRAVRLDSIPLSKAYYTEEGYLIDKPVVTSVGIFEYMNRDGSTRRELRLPEEVFDAESLRSYKGVPIVISHDAGLIDKDNVSENQIGTVLSNGFKDGDDVRAEIIIHDTDELKKSRMRELSLGYNLDLDETPGEWNGEHYDAIQRNIRINHLAIVRDARAGEQARLNLDGRDNDKLLKGGKKMSKKMKNARRADAVLSDEELAKAIEEYKKRRAEEGADVKEDEDAPEIAEKPIEEPKKEELKPAEVKPEPVKVDDSDEVNSKIQSVKDNRNARDLKGDPKDVDEAMGTIAHQDEDIDTLFDIIDTLLAKLDFNEAKPEPEANQDSVDDIEKLNGDEDVLPEEEEVSEEEEFVSDEDEPVEDLPEEDEFAEDEGEEDEEFLEDEDEEPEEFLEDEDDEFEEEDEFVDDKHINMDSIDRIVSEKLMLGKLGRQVGLKNLEHKSTIAAKKAIIRRVAPEMRLDGKSDVYINAAFDSAKSVIRHNSKKDTSYQKRQMFNSKRTNMDSETASAESARNKMIKRQAKRK